MRTRALLLGLAVLAGCSALPRDPEGTLNRVRSSKVMRVGLTNDPAVNGSTATDVLGRLERATGARIAVVRDEQEPLLQKLERGNLDLVFARFSPKTPWADRVALAPPIAERFHEIDQPERLPFRAAVRNGENRWAMLVETESRAVADAGR